MTSGTVEPGRNGRSRRAALKGAAAASGGAFGSGDGGALRDRPGNTAVWNVMMHGDGNLARRWNEFMTS